MTAPDEYLDISTPENIVFGYQIAGIGSRFLAALVDTTLIVILQFIVNLTLLFLASAVLDVPVLMTGSTAFSWLAGILGLVSFAFLWGYYIFFELSWNGQSPGKRKAGLRVIRSDGTPIGLSEAVIRNLVRLLDFLPLYYGVGVITMFIDSRARRLGDMAAGTLVVYDSGTVTLESLASTANRATPVTHFSPNVSSWQNLPRRRLQSREIALAESFLRRRHELENQDAIAIELAQTLLKKMELPVRELSEPEAIALLRTVVDQEPARPPAIDPAEPEL